MHTIFVLIWLSNLSRTDSYFSIYLLIGFASIYLSIRKPSEFQIYKVNFVIPALLAASFSCSVLLANYPLFTTIGDPATIGRSTSIIMNLINGFLTLAGGFAAWYPIIQYVLGSFPRQLCIQSCKIQFRLHAVAVFAVFLFVNLIHLFLVEYPGNVTEDPFSQIAEMVSGSYSNFNTYWHTMLFRVILIAGYQVFQDFNAAVVLFCVLQAVVVCFAFTYSIMTMRDAGVPGIFLWAAFILYGFVPYNIAMSITVWKDVLFAASVLLMISSWIRIVKNIDSTVSSYCVFIISSILLFISRTNGWIIYLVSFLLSIWVLRSNRKFLCVMGILSIFGWFLLNPALSILNVQSSDPVESLSVPIQQVSRVIADGGRLTEEEEELLSIIVDLEEVPALYTNWISDPMKVEVRSKNYEYFLENKAAYTDLWFKIGLRYPWEYIKAWVDQTKGYWNGGYDYAMYSETVTDNPYGVYKTMEGNPVASAFRMYFGLSRHLIFFEPLHSIGLHVWIMLLCFLLNILRKRLDWIYSLPFVLLVLGLCLGTPVYACFRYVYPLFVSLPLILSTTLWVPETE